MVIFSRRLLFAAALLMCPIGLTDCFGQSASEGGVQFFESKVQPILRQRCFGCHSHRAGKARGGLVVDSIGGMITGGESGPTVVPGDVEASLLLTAVGYEDDALQMPPSGRLEQTEIDVLIEWVRLGAPAPASKAQKEQHADSGSPSSDDHWAFQPLSQPAIPPLVAGGSESIDYLVEQSRRAAGVTAVRAADKRTVALRLYSDLIGLPPTPEEIDAIGATTESDLDILTERLLGMAEFGERWGRHWLDVARYSDSNGCSIESNNTHDNAWRYRDYVIAALNNDKPYDRFVTEQIAGDLLDYVSTTQRCEQLIATGFLVLGPKAFGTSGFDQLRFDVIDEQIDTVGKAMLGMSFGCARCHDHKFDPVPTTDYYALAGVFSSTQSVRKQKGWRQGKTWNRVKLPMLDQAAEEALQAAYDQKKAAADSGDLKKHAEAELKKAQQTMADVRGKSPEDQESIAKAEAAVAAAEREMTNASNMAKVMPVISPLPVAMAVAETETPVDEAVRIRGEVDNLGDVVPRRIPTLMGAADDEAAFSIAGDESGRLQLARWLVDSERGSGALLARVAVNRIWGHLFAKPLVPSADNFGLTGQPPTHAELLDYLAQRFIESGWSVKSLIRDIVGTDTYALAAAENSYNDSIDPDNIWLWRYQPRRIDAEVLRDSMLAISGQLDRTRGGKTLQHLGLVSLGGDHLVLDQPSPYLRRTVYIPVYRDTIGLTDEVDASMGLLATFDFADPNLMAGARAQTTVPAQSLFLMNDEFVHQQSKQLAIRLIQDEKFSDDRERVKRIFESLYGRDAEAAEIDEALHYIEHFAGLSSQPDAETVAWTSLCQAMFGSNEFLFLD